jgi:hypothetical protein
MRCFRFTLAIAAAIAVMACSPYQLPAPDGGIPNASEASLEGWIVSVSPALIQVARNRGTWPSTEVISIALLESTDCFSAFGGIVDREELKPGQYVWVWFVSRHDDRTHTPPRAGLVMPFSKDPLDQPDEALRAGWKP